MDRLYEEGVRYAYDATHAPSLALTQRYYDKAARLFEQAAKQVSRFGLGDQGLVRPM